LAGRGGGGVGVVVGCLDLILPGRPWWRGGPVVPSSPSPSSSVPALCSLLLVTLTAFWRPRWLLECLFRFPAAASLFFPGVSPRRLEAAASVSPSGLNGCRAPLRLLRCSAGICPPRCSKWSCSPAVAWWPARSDAVGGLVVASGPDRVSTLCLGSFLHFLDRFVIPLFYRVCL
jgi:hypothetical protein